MIRVSITEIIAKSHIVPATAIAQVAGSVRLDAIAIFLNCFFDIFSIFPLKKAFLTNTMMISAIAIWASQKYPATYGSNSLDTLIIKNTVIEPRSHAINEYKIPFMRLSLSRWSNLVLLFEIIIPQISIIIIDAIAIQVKYSWKNIHPRTRDPMTLVIVLRLAEIPIGSFFTAE